MNQRESCWSPLPTLELVCLVYHLLPSNRASQTTRDRRLAGCPRRAWAWHDLRVETMFLGWPSALPSPETRECSGDLLHLLPLRKLTTDECAPPWQLSFMMEAIPTQCPIPGDPVANVRMYAMLKLLRGCLVSADLEPEKGKSIKGHPSGPGKALRTVLVPFLSLPLQG